MLRNIKPFFIIERFSSNFKKIGFACTPFKWFSEEKNDAKGLKDAPPDYYDAKKKISKINFLKMELAQNPEFDKAFPFLKNYKKDSTIFPKDEELDFIESLR